MGLWKMFFTRLLIQDVVLAHYTNSNIVRYTRKISRLFVTKFYHDRKKSLKKKDF